jgi:hypothetical protein
VMKLLFQTTHTRVFLYSHEIIKLVSIFRIMCHVYILPKLESRDGVPVLIKEGSGGSFFKEENFHHLTMRFLVLLL